MDIFDILANEAKENTVYKRIQYNMADRLYLDNFRKIDQIEIAAWEKMEEER